MKPDEGDINWLKQTVSIPDFFLLFSLEDLVFGRHLHHIDRCRHNLKLKFV